jgi:hypothetical protein
MENNKNKKNIPINENLELKNKVEQLKAEGWNGKKRPDPAKFVDLMLEQYPNLFKALAK